ncbi:hypothetical protein OUZ56_003486 [Daphnia magna]|uniref:Uncharacterized protein n=1 Tax=Daphnia magna TaxID=35525 RepID=A0ABR0A8V6_9CRUS|nr:hypothetical protein OUZ56_003486 [Daphnia magna]
MAQDTDQASSSNLINFSITVSVTEASPDSTGFSISLNSSKAPNVALFPAILVLETDRLQYLPLLAGQVSTRHTSVPSD